MDTEKRINKNSMNLLMAFEQIVHSNIDLNKSNELNKEINSKIKSNKNIKVKK